jgi:hypothetical protein
MSQLSIQDVNSAIMFGSFTNEQLNSAADAIRFRRAQLARETRRTIAVGSVVKFTNNRTGRTHQGNVVKIKIKNATVRENSMLWNVPLNLLSVAE